MSVSPERQGVCETPPISLVCFLEAGHQTPDQSDFCLAVCVQSRQPGGRQGFPGLQGREGQLLEGTGQCATPPEKSDSVGRQGL